MNTITQEGKDFVLNKWVPALRSGKYNQGGGRLRRVVMINDCPIVRHCCLGVAAEEMGVKFQEGNTSLVHTQSEFLGLDSQYDILGWGSRLEELS